MPTIKTYAPATCPQCGCNGVQVKAYIEDFSSPAEGTSIFSMGEADCPDCRMGVTVLLKGSIDRQDVAERMARAACSSNKL